MTASEREFFFAPAVVEGRVWYARGHVSPAQAEYDFTEEYDLESRDLKGGPPAVLLSGLITRSETPQTLLPNGRVIYSRIDQAETYHGGSLWEIWADPRSGQAKSKARRIADWPDFEIWGLSATADGQRLAFVRAQALTSVYVADLEGNGFRIVDPQRLTLSDSEDHAYDWTSDSKSVLFDSNRNGTWDIFRQALDQRMAEKLVASPGGSIRPALSPDGASVLYLTPSTEPGFHPPLKIMRVALTGGPPQFLGDIQGSGEIRCARTANLCVVSDVSSKQQTLYALDPVKGKAGEPLMMGPASDPSEGADWDVCPDGSSLAFIRSAVQSGASQIEIRPLAGGAPRRQLNLSGRVNVLYFRWAADAKGWYVTASSPSGSILLKVDLTGKAQQLMQGYTWGDAIASPDQHHVAIMGRALTSNVWMLENF